MFSQVFYKNLPPKKYLKSSPQSARQKLSKNPAKLCLLKCFPILKKNCSGNFMLNITFGQGKYYIDNLVEIIHQGQRQKFRNGVGLALPH